MTASKFSKVFTAVVVSVILFTTPAWPIGLVIAGAYGIGWLKRRNARMGRH